MALLKKDSPDYLLNEDKNPFKVMPDDLSYDTLGLVLLNFYENIFISFYYLTLMWFIISISELKEPSNLFSVRHENQYKDCLDEFEPYFNKYLNFFHPYCEFIYNTEETIIRLSKSIRRLDLDMFFCLLLYCNFSQSLAMIFCKDYLVKFLETVFKRILDCIDQDLTDVSQHPFY